MRSLECWTSEPKRASLVRRWTSSVSAALSSASETSVASAARLLCSARGIRFSPAIASSPCVSPRTESGSRRVDADVAGTRSSTSALADRRRGEPDAPLRSSSAAAVAGVTGHAAASSPSATRTRSPSARQSRAATSSPASARAAPSAAWQMSARLVAATRSAPTALRIRSRATERSCWRTSPAMRATTRPNRMIAATLTTKRSSPSSMTCSSAITGAISEAQVSITSRSGVSRGSRSGAARSSSRHRRVQRRRAPQQVEADPADVEPHLAVVGAREGDQAVGEVGREQGDDARDEQVERRPARARVHREPDGGREQQDVADRIGDRDQLGHRRELLVVQRRLDQRDPRDQREAERDDQRVDRTGAVALRVAPPHEDQQADHQRGVDEHVRRVAERRERHLGAGQPRIAVGVEVAQPEQQEPDREPAPRARRDSRA